MIAPGSIVRLAYNPMVTARVLRTVPGEHGNGRLEIETTVFKTKMTVYEDQCDLDRDLTAAAKAKEPKP